MNSRGHLEDLWEKEVIFMPRKKMMISVGTCIKIMRQEADIMENDDIKVGDNAAEAMGKVLFETAREITRKAAKLAKHAGRKTIKEEDVLLAVEME